ncbi:MAG: 50S ribosomal protein L2 [Candidatus Pacebacteria bacterium GW2011_GWF2_38_9]|nr:MAG: 50S ribosomal protein L2, large subunit ribosomal protein L2 [candidate division TM6 bacterium GW2011_GWF2_28_16]KKQ07457.1 MAG: 50S ribosomal protein L2 [Candidatus Pacebacteria bacterium GW2011_GWF1_36_5]KKQ88560.1 MAG: 50S ribosomal protein L2 [Candidatus Pacebacteria bacterium GW2011_GWF2_38_9]HAZ73533.1 50S ribosomal protein L2 [Candidatus Paceibacterota bacterium]
MLKKMKGTTPGKRHRVDNDRSSLHKGDPEKSLLAKGHKKRQGKDASGHISMRHRGGGVKKKMRVVDFRRTKVGIPAIVKRIEYDPMRSANVALLFYKDGEKSYIIAPEGLEIGAEIIADEKTEVKVGNCMKLKNVPIGVEIHNIELRAGKGAQIVRGAGLGAMIQSKEGKYAIIALPSKEHRLVNLECIATIGSVGNQEWKGVKLGKAGRKRMMGIRPTVRGTAQHPDSHPHGGGEGRSGVGMKHAKSPWGKNVAPGKKTRSVRKSNRHLVRDRRAKN